MSKMFKETVNAIMNHPKTKNDFNEYWDEDIFSLPLDELNHLIVTRKNEYNSFDITYWHFDEHKQKKCLRWDEDKCVVEKGYETHKLDEELAYFQIMTDIKEKAATMDD